jgi:hypothetical protein
MPMIVSNCAVPLVIPSEKQAVFTKWTRSLERESVFDAPRLWRVVCACLIVITGIFPRHRSVTYSCIAVVRKNLQWWLFSTSKEEFSLPSGCFNIENWGVSTDSTFKSRTYVVKNNMFLRRGKHGDARTSMELVYAIHSLSRI